MSRPTLLTSPTLLVALLVACSPAQPQPVVIATPPKPSASVAPPPLASHAKWLSPSATEGSTNEQIDLGARGILQVGNAGRRWLIASDGKVTASPFLLPASLVDVRAEGKQFLFLGQDGSTFLADEPLGPATITRAAPVTVEKHYRKPLFCVGKSALMGLEGDGSLHRSTDVGVTWAKSKLPVLAGEEAVALAANRKGEVLVILYPQRVLLSTDDGATFNPLETPGIGASNVKRDAHDELWLEGAIVEKSAKLIATPRRLEITDRSSFAEHATRKSDKASKTESKSKGRRHVVGDRVVTEQDSIDPATKRRKVTLAVETFGGEPGAPFTLAEAASPFARVRLAGHDKELVADLYEPEADPPVSKLFRTTDEGKTWQPIGSLEGKEAPGFRLLVAPGWVAVGELCDPSDGQCRPARAKAGNAKEFQPLGLPQHVRLSSVEYDATRDRLVVVADEGKATEIFAGKRDGKLARIEAPQLEARPVSTTMTSQGALLVAYASPWRLLSLGADGKVSAPSYLPFDVQHADFAGDHGYAYGNEGAFETADAGMHWTKVAAGATGVPSCAPSGCVQGDAVRVGWDLPDPNKPLVATSDKPISKKAAPPSPPPVDPGPPIKIACKPTGTAKKLKGNLWGEQRAALDGDVRFVATLGGEDSTTAIEVVKGSGAPTVVNLLAPSKPGGSKTVREWVDTDAQGVVVARYSYVAGAKYHEDGTKEYNPVDVDLAWYSASAGKAHKVSLPKVKPFRVGRVAPSALHVITDGGLLFMPLSGEAPLYFVRDDGKMVTIPRPAGADPWGFSDGVKIGDRIVLAQTRGDAVALVSSDDAGKTWSTKIWSTGEPGSLVALAGKPTLAFGFGTMFGPSEPSGLLSFDKLTSDPPPARRWAPESIAIGSKGIVACNAKTRVGVRAYTFGADGDREVELGLAAGGDVPPTLPMSGRFTRFAADGSSCVDMLVGSTDGDKGHFSLFAPTDDLAHAWLAWTHDDGKVDVRPFACTM